MQEQSTPDPAKTLALVERGIMVLLSDRDEQRPWSVHELEVAMDDRVAVADSLSNLRSVGLLHSCGEFVWATRVALYALAMEI